MISPLGYFFTLDFSLLIFIPFEIKLLIKNKENKTIANVPRNKVKAKSETIAFALDHLYIGTYGPRQKWLFP